MKTTLIIIGVILFVVILVLGYGVYRVAKMLNQEDDEEIDPLSSLARLKERLKKGRM